MIDLLDVRRSITALIIVSVTAILLPLYGQGKRATVASAKPAASGTCSGAWTGTVSYSRTQSMTDNKTVDRVSGRGKDMTNSEMKYEYKAQVAVVEDPSRNASSRGIASINHKLTATETTKAVEKNSCDRGKTWRGMTGTFTSQSQTTGSEKADANVHVGVNADGSYSVGVGLPQIRGQSTGKQTSTFSGQCTAKEGKTLTIPATPTSIEGNSLTSDGSHRVNPGDPNRLSGSFTRSWENVTESITWSLQKCGADLRFTDLKFADMVFPNWNEWRELNDQTGTVDGNFVKMTAKVLNTSGETKYAEVQFKETYKGDKWDGSRPEATLEDQTVQVRVEPGEEREVEAVWDTSGYSWFDDGRPRLVQRIKAEVWELNKKTDDITRNIKVAPKPLILVHGLWSNWKAWEPWQNILTTSHSYDWKAFPVGEKPANGVMNTGGEFLSTTTTNSIAQNAEQVKRYIDYAQRDRNAWHVVIVGHSMGGLIARDYINRLMPLNYTDGRPQVTKLIMLGTPNTGSPCADVMNSAFEVLGKNVEAVRQLRQNVVAEFNRTTVNRKGVKFSVLAGDPLPTMCKTVVWNDGVVPVPSAKWQIADNAISKSLHTDLTGTKDFSDFVKPRLAIGPKGNHNPEAPHIPTTTGNVGIQDSGLNFAVFSSSNSYYAFERYLDLPVVTAFASQPYAQAKKIGPMQTIEIAIPVDAANNFGVTFMAAHSVSLTLISPYGTEAGKNVANSPEANGMFRSVYVDRAVTKGTWTVRVHNSGDRENEIILTIWTNAVS